MLSLPAFKYLWIYKTYCCGSSDPNSKIVNVGDLAAGNSDCHKCRLWQHIPPIIAEFRIISSFLMIIIVQPSMNERTRD